MKKAIVLNSSDIFMLQDVLEYFIDTDDAEKQDFKNNYGDHLFNDHDVLMLDKVPKDATVHVFYKLSYLQEQLLQAENE